VQHSTPCVQLAVPHPPGAIWPPQYCSRLSAERSFPTTWIRLFPSTGTSTLAELRCLVGGLLELLCNRGSVSTYEVRLCLSELYGNAVRHAGGPTRVRVWYLTEDCRVVIAVTDRGSTPPAVRAFNGDDESGRGLSLVCLLAHDLGYTLAEDGKDVWCSLTLDANTGRH